MLGRTLLIATALMLLLAPAASAQQDVTATSMQYSSEASQSDPTVGIARGESGFMFVRPVFCFGGPGLNPNEGAVTAELEIVSTPSWVELIPPTEPITWVPEQVNPSQDETCKPGEWQLNFKITQNAPYGEQATVDVKVTVTSGDIGTYKAPTPAEWTNSIPVAVKEPEIDPVTGVGGGGTNATTTPTSDTTEESPALGPMVVMLAIVAFAALRRRD